MLKKRKLQFATVGIVVALLIVAAAFRRQPVLVHALADTDCACGEYHANVTGWIVLNPFRDRAPEQAANRFLQELRDGTCTAGDAVLCQYALDRHRVSEWRLATLHNTNDDADLYYKLTKFGITESQHRLTGEALIHLQKVQGRWTVTTYSAYF